MSEPSIIVEDGDEPGSATLRFDRMPFVPEEIKLTAAQTRQLAGLLLSTIGRHVPEEPDR